MINVRKNVFETNSSSTHSISIYTDKEFEEMNKKKDDPNYLFDDWREEFCTIEDIITNYEKSELFDERVIGEKLRTFLSGRELKDCLQEEFDTDGTTFEEYLNDNLELKSINYRNGNDYDYYGLEEDYTQYTTPGGEHLHIICKYGYNG